MIGTSLAVNKCFYKIIFLICFLLSKYFLFDKTYFYLKKTVIVSNSIIFEIHIIIFTFNFFINN